VQLVAVTKRVPAVVAADLAGLGAPDLGENRADELELKARVLAERGATVRWHFVGHLQGNKARRVVALADAIHSIDSLKLLSGVDRLARELGRRPVVFLQIKLHPEAEKSGMHPDEAPDAIAAARELAHVRLRGLMTMAPLVGSSGSARLDAARRVFERLRDIAEACDGGAFERGRAELSMGMSDDFEVAIAAGSDWVRVGTALFGGIAAAPSARSPHASAPRRGEVER
jgi:pyridoxal phosphate enzyme (YggS family)